MRSGRNGSTHLAGGTGGDGAIQMPGARGLARGVCRSLYHLGYTCLTEFKLASRRRVDIIGMDAGGVIMIVEVKSSIEDFRADRKWREYQDFCDFFFFAVAEDFPREVLPEECGLLIADPYGAVLVRQAPELKLNAARRRAQTLRFAHVAGQRLARFVDPGPIPTPTRPRNPGRRANAATRLL
jgi:hypothetical protein